MEWLRNFNEAINYIEEHLTDEIDLNKLGKIAGCSGFHFQRMFSYMADIPLSEYIRRRKMSLAAVTLQNGEKVLDVALKYGYDSPTAFNRAFQSVHLKLANKRISFIHHIKEYIALSTLHSPEPQSLYKSFLNDTLSFSRQMSIKNIIIPMSIEL